MPSVGPGVIELRIHCPIEYRLLVVTRLNEAVHVLHVFEKKTPKTSRRDLELGRCRYSQLMIERSK